MLRADRFATLYLFHPLAKLSAAQPRIPILMYHSVANREEQKHPYYRTVTSPARFAEQMRALRDEGYAAISVDQAVKQLASGSHPKQVAITFDDGFEDFYTNAFPILQQYGFTATMYLATSFVGDQTQAFKSIPCMTWSQVRELSALGIEFGSHTVSHPQLHTLPPNQVRAEVEESKSVIEQELGRAVTSFAYPFAFPEADRNFTGMLKESLLASGYGCGVSTIIGTASSRDDSFFLPRLPVNSCDDRSLFRAKLNRGYDWLHSAQLASKLIASIRSKPRLEVQHTT